MHRGVLFAAALLTLIAAIALVWALRPAAVLREMRLEISTPPTTDPVSFAIAPDGGKLVFSAALDGQSQLWLRHLDSTRTQPIPGTDGASFPFWSPDSRSLGFFAEGKLKQIDIAGGAPRVLANAPTGRGGTWNTSGDILFAPTSFPGPLYRVSSKGGDPVAATQADDQQLLIQRFPQFLPDGSHFLFYVPAPVPERRAVFLGSLDSAKPRRLLDADAAAVFLPPRDILFIREGKLFAQRFEVNKLETTGDPQLLAEQVAADPTRFIAALSAASGVVAYRVRTSAGPRQLKWFDRNGKLLGVVGEPDPEQPLDPELSPDGNRVAIDRTLGGNRDVWILDTASGFRTRFTFDGAVDYLPVWSPDGSRIIFASFRSQAAPSATAEQLYEKPSNGAADEQLFLQSQQVKLPTDWSRDGRFVLFKSVDPRTNYDLWALPLNGDRKPFPIVNTTFEERDGQFSPDGHWLAYSSNEAGRFDVYVQPFPGPGGKSLVSANGGGQARWRKDGKELFYVAPDGQLMAVPIRLEPEKQRVDIGKAAALFVTRLAGDVTPGSSKHQYAVSSDGQRFLMNVTAEQPSAAPITLIVNWKSSQ